MSTLDQIRQREAAATKGPWKARGLQSSTAILDGSDKVLASLGDPLSGYNWKAAEFISHARTDIPRLLAALDAVLAACNRIIDNTDGHKPPGPPYPTREQGTAVRIRAAITDALGDTL